MEYDEAADLMEIGENLKYQVNDVRKERGGREFFPHTILEFFS